MQETFKISDNAIKLNYILNTIAYSQSNTQEVEKSGLRDRIKIASELLYSENTKEQRDSSYLTIFTILQVSKAIEDDEMIIKAYEYLIKKSENKEQTELLSKVLKSSVNLFEFEDEEIKKHIFNLLQGMGVTNIREVYQELDLLQVDLFNKPLHIK